MESHESWGIAVRRSMPLITLLSLLLAGLVWIVLSKLEPKYEVHFSYLVSPAEREQTDEYSFDGYWALSATDLFAETLTQWITTPENIALAYQYAKVDLPADLATLTRSVAAQKKSGQLVAVTVLHEKETQAREIAQGLQQVVAENLDRYHGQDRELFNWELLVTDFWVGRQARADRFIVGATFIFAFLILINVVILRASLNKV